MKATGLFDKLIDAGYRYAFVSNSDNLGAVPDARVAGWFAESGAPFAIEAVRRTPSDRKGGHFATPQGRRPHRAPRDRADRRQGQGGARRPRAPQVLLHQQPVVRPRADARRARPPRQHPRPAADPQREERRPERPEEPQGDPDRDRDGRGHRGVPRLAHHRGRPRPVRAGQDDQRPAGAALRRLRPRQRLRARPGRREPAVHRPRRGLQGRRGVRQALPGRGALAQGGRLAGRRRRLDLRRAGQGEGRRQAEGRPRPRRGRHGPRRGQLRPNRVGTCLPTRTLGPFPWRTTSNGCSRGSSRCSPSSTR